MSKAASKGGESNSWPLSGRACFEEAEACRLCGFKFHMFARRHHCRECGRSVCYDHSLSFAIDYLSSLSEDERAWIFGETALEVWRF